MKSERELQDVIDIVAENPSITDEELDAELKKLEELRKAASSRQIYEHSVAWGRESEQIVKDILEDLDVVDRVRTTTPRSWEDREGRDLVVYFEQDRFLYVQVKSSEQELQKFIGNKKKARRKLRIRKLIVLNGREEEEEIEKVFLQELKLMDDYWRKREQPILSDELRDKLINQLEEIQS